MSLWVALTVLGVFLVLNVPFFTAPLSAEGKVIDEAFQLLMVLAVPVFTFVLVIVGYSALRFRAHGDPERDGPPIRSSRGVLIAWFVVTTALTALVIIDPGITGMMHLRHSASAHEGLVVRAEGRQWLWKFEYPEHGVTTFNELVLPVDEQVRFDVTAADVLHSFWVPAFRVKVDAVPGLVTTTHATPTETGDSKDNFDLRVQCAEMCGTGHAIMAARVRVVSPDEFRAWLVSRGAK